MTTKVPKFCLLSPPSRLTFHPWAVLGEGCSSARGSNESHGRFTFHSRIGLGRLRWERVASRCDFSPLAASLLRAHLVAKNSPGMCRKGQFRTQTGAFFGVQMEE